MARSAYVRIECGECGNTEEVELIEGAEPGVWIEPSVEEDGLPQGWVFDADSGEYFCGEDCRRSWNDEEDDEEEGWE